MDYELMLEITQVLSLLIVIVGLVGNVLLFVIYSRGSLRQLSISIYFRAIAVVNFFITLNMLKVFFREKYSFSLTNINLFACKLVYYTIYSAGPISSWTLVVISIDRLLTLAWPKRLPCLARTRFQLAVLGLVFLYNMTFYAYLLVDARFHNDSTAADATTYNHTNGTTRNNNNNNTLSSHNCDISNEPRLYWLDLFNSSLLPFVSMMVTSALTIVFIVRSRRKFSASRNRSLSVVNCGNGSGSSSGVVGGGAGGGGGGSGARASTATTRVVMSSKRALRDRKFAITSVSLNVLFLILNVPAPFFGVVSTLVDIDIPLNNFIGYLSLCCYYSYYAISFYVQLAVNSIVRERFVRFFKPVANVKTVKVPAAARHGSMTSTAKAIRFRSLQIKR